MTSPDMNPNTRPLGYWLKAVDRLMAEEFAQAFAAEGITRRDWRQLNVVAGSAPAHRPLTAARLHRLRDLGWVTGGPNNWNLTDAGTDALKRIAPIVDGIRAKVTDAVPEADLETTLKTLEQLATAFGWEEGVRLPRGIRRRHDHGHTRGHRDDHRRGDGEGHRAAGRGHWHGRGHGAGRSRAAFERGFASGYDRAARGDRTHHHDHRDGRRGPAWAQHPYAQHPYGQRPQHPHDGAPRRCPAA